MRQLSDLEFRFKLNKYGKSGRGMIRGGNESILKIHLASQDYRSRIYYWKLGGSKVAGRKFGSKPGSKYARNFLKKGGS